MANLEINELNPKTLAGTDQIPVDDVDNVTWKIYASDILDPINTLNDAVGAINGEIDALNSSVSGLGTTLANTVSALNTPQIGEIYVSLNGDIGNTGTITYPFASVEQGIAAAFSNTPTINSPYVVLTAPGVYLELNPLEINPYISIQGEEGAPPQILVQGPNPLTLSADWNGNPGDTNLVNLILSSGFSFNSQSSTGGTIKIKNVDTQGAYCQLLGSGNTTSFYEIENLKATSGGTIFAGNFSIINCDFGDGLDLQGKSTGTSAYINGLKSSVTTQFSGTDGPLTVTLINSPELGGPIYIHNTQVTLLIDNLSASNGFILDNGASIDQVTFLDSGASNQHVIYAGLNGNDTNGNGTFDNPYATYSRAAISISLTTDIYNVISLFPGIYNEAGDTIAKPNTGITGDSYTTCNLTLNGGANNLILDSSWTGNDGIFNINNISLVGGINFDFNSIGANSAIFNFNSMWVFAGFSLKGLAGAGAGTFQCIIDNSTFDNSILTSDSLTTYLLNSFQTNDVNILTSVNDSYFNCSNSFISTNVLLQSSGGFSVTAAISCTPIGGTLTIDGTNVFLSIDIASYKTPIFLNGATISQITFLNTDIDGVTSINNGTTATNISIAYNTVSGPVILAGNANAVIASKNSTSINGEANSIIASEMGEIGSGNQFCLLAAGSSSKIGITSPGVSYSVNFGSDGEIKGGVNFSAILTGQSNNIDTSSNSAITSGTGNSITNSASSLISSGSFHQITSSVSDSAILSGTVSQITGSSLRSVIVGGTSHLINTGTTNSGIVAGNANEITHNDASGILAGNNNLIEGSGETSSAVIAGQQNTINGSQSSVIGYGQFNNIVNSISSFAGGTFAQVATGHQGVFIITDTTPSGAYASDNSNQFKSFFTGGTRLLGGNNTSFSGASAIANGNLENNEIQLYSDSGTNQLTAKYKDNSGSVHSLVLSSLGTSGTWTPTITNGTNVASSTANKGRYQRIGNTVFVDGYITVTSTLTLNATQVKLSLPVASNFGAADDASGGGVTSNALLTSIAVSADSTNDLLVLDWTTSTQVVNQQVHIWGSYTVI